MTPAEMSAEIVEAIDALSVIFAFTAAAALIIARREGPTALTLAMVVALALGWGIAHGFYPPLVAWRMSVGFAQPLVIFGLIAILTLASATQPARAYFRAAKLRPLISLYGWRAVFGGSLLLLGFHGALPPGFFWPAAIGDILVGLWALSMQVGWRSVTRTEFLAWNAVGLLDLLNVLRLGVLELRPFFDANPDLTPLTLLPLFGVPFFTALHIQLFRTIWHHKHV